MADAPLTSIEEMCGVLATHLVKASEYTDSAVLYQVTFEQLRNIYDQGKRAAQPQPAQPLTGASDGQRTFADEVGIVGAVIVGDMHRVLLPARFPKCIECGCESDQFSKLCKAYLK